MSSGSKEESGGPIRATSRFSDSVWNVLLIGSTIKTCGPVDFYTSYTIRMFEKGDD